MTLSPRQHGHPAREILQHPDVVTESNLVAVRTSDRPLSSQSLSAFVSAHDVYNDSRERVDIGFRVATSFDTNMRIEFKKV